MRARAWPAAKNPIPILLTLCLWPWILASCSARSQAPSAAAPTPVATPTTAPAPIIAFLRDGELWKTAIDDATSAQILATAPSGEVISDFVWSADSSELFYLIGAQIHRVSIADKQPKPIGTPQLPTDLLIDRLEETTDPRILIILTVDAEGANRSFSFKLDDQSTSELSVDQYNALALPNPPVVRKFSDLAVGPDLARLLFKEVVGTNEVLFVADLNTGARLRLTDLGEIGDFEETAQLDGTRRLLEAAWSPDGRFAVFNPAQSCSETGLCYGYLYLIDSLGGVAQKLSQEMVVAVAVDWAPDGKRIVMEDGGQIVVVEIGGDKRRLTEGNRPKWQRKRV